MYYPYLRAKQFELKALREFSEEHSGSNIVPILEPVKKQSVALERAVGDMMENKMRFALVLNPTDGDFKHDTVSFGAWLEESKQLLMVVKLKIGFLLSFVQEDFSMIFFL